MLPLRPRSRQRKDPTMPLSFRPIRARVLPVLLLLLAAVPGAPEGRQPFAPGAPPQEMPERAFDLRHVRLDLAFDWKKGEVAGTATNTLAPLRPGTDTLVFHAADLRVSKVRLAGQDLWFSLDPQAENFTTCNDLVHLPTS